jgi:hypothetical protein
VAGRGVAECGSVDFGWVAGVGGVFSGSVERRGLTAAALRRGRWPSAQPLGGERVQALECPEDRGGPGPVGGAGDVAGDVKGGEA